MNNVLVWGCAWVTLCILKLPFLKQCHTQGVVVQQFSSINTNLNTF